MSERFYSRKTVQKAAMNPRPLVLGACAGLVSGTLVGLLFLLLVPEATFSYWEVSALPSLLGWAFFISWLPSAIVGAAGGVVTDLLRGGLNSSTRRLALAVIIASVTGVITQLLLPTAWQLPRVKIALVIVAPTLVCARISIWFVLSRLNRV